MKTSEILIKARALIEDETRWTQGDLARDAHGQMVFPRDPDAVCWCALGAVSKAFSSEVYGDPFTTSPMYRLDAAAATLSDTKHMPAGIFNDTRKHHEVLKMFDLAIELAKAEE